MLSLPLGVRPRDGAAAIAMSWTHTQHEHHELLLRLRAVENDRWILRAASSGRSEVIDPRGVPSEDGIEIGQTGFIVLPFAHRSTMALGGQLFFLGTAAGIATLLFVLLECWRWWRGRLEQKQSRLALVQSKVAVQ